MVKNLEDISKKDNGKLTFKKAKSALSISVSSKIGTGAIIGVLAALWKTSDNGVGGEAIVLWVLIGMIILVPLTYAEVLFSQVTKKLPRLFVEFNLGSKSSLIYIISLVILYSFGFVGFQFTGIQTVGIILSDKLLGYTLSSTQMLFFIVVPMIVVTAIIILTKSHLLFINVLGSLISIVIIFYLIMFIIFLYKTRSFIPEYISDMFNDFLDFRTMGIGLPIGLVLGFQRIIQISETALGTSALASSDRENSPRKEAFLQVVATLITLFVAVGITSYVFAYGRANIAGVELSGNGFNRIVGYIKSVETITGSYGLFVILIFFLFSGYCTVLGSFHFLNTSMKISDNKK
ncbi:alanine:cation symporter family protein [Thiospirochaeta perfilievii]|uniref:alanine:cation symporter family protein n=1 Tax=Thiospirochaeta perfilievii TaxID=252967 RepID=UPI001CA7FE9F|nr:alanine:cation symporter family protein [Thiospirochaeta perfilievii]